MTTAPRPTGYCRNCGKELFGNPELCMSCGARPMAGNAFCPACGGPTNALSEICVKCGARLGAAPRVTGAAVAPGVSAAPRTSKPTWAGVLLIIGGVFGIIGGIVLAIFGSAFALIGFGLDGVGAGVVTIILSVVTLIGGIRATQRKQWSFALAGAICAVFGSLIFGIVAIILLALSKKEFA